MGRTGMVQRCYITSGAAAMGNVQGGSLDIDPNILRGISIDGVEVNHGGLVKTVLEVDLHQPLKTLMTAMLRSAGTDTVSAQSFIVGTEGGYRTVAGAQPSGFTYSCSVDAIPECRVGYWAITPSETVADQSGTPQPAIGATGINDEWSKIDVLVGTANGTGVDYECQRFEVTLNTNPIWHTSLDSRSTDSKRLPTAVYLGLQEWTVRLDCAERIPESVGLAIADSIATNLAVTIDGGGSGSTSIDFDLNSLPSPKEPTELVGPNDVPIWRYEWTKSTNGTTICV